MSNSYIQDLGATYAAAAAAKQTVLPVAAKPHSNPASQTTAVP